MAVPVILAALGADLYGVWVLAGVLIMSQGLLDLGVSAAVVREASVAATTSSRRHLSATLRVAACVYGVLVLAIGLPAFLFAGALVDVILDDAARSRADAILLVRAAAASFGLAAVGVVCGAALQGLGRVDAAFRGQAFSWALYIPTLLLGMRFAADVEAVAAAWVVVYAVQALVLPVGLSRAAALVGDQDAESTSVSAILSLGAGWQVSSWADFATFQLPRVVAGVLLTTEDLVVLDVALRFAQLVVLPVFVVLPLALPRAAAAWAAGGIDAVRRLLVEVGTPAALVVAVGAAALAPLAEPAIALWTAVELSSGAAIMSGVLVIAFAAHASTGLGSAVLLACASVRSVVVYKFAQLVLAVALVPAGAAIGGWWTGLGVAVALLLPAVAFNTVVLRRFGALPPRRWMRDVLAGAGASAVAVSAVVVAVGDASAIVTAAVGVALASVALVIAALRAARFRAAVASH